jgi:hypothetical protein
LEKIEQTEEEVNQEYLDSMKTDREALILDLEEKGIIQFSEVERTNYEVLREALEDAMPSPLLAQFAGMSTELSTPLCTFCIIKNDYILTAIVPYDYFSPEKTTDMELFEKSFNSNAVLQYSLFVGTEQETYKKYFISVVSRWSNEALLESKNTIDTILKSRKDAEKQLVASKVLQLLNEKSLTNKSVYNVSDVSKLLGISEYKVKQIRDSVKVEDSE